MRPLLKYLFSILETNDDEIVADALWAWAYLAEMENYKGEDILNKITQKKLIMFIGKEKSAATFPALRIIGDICSGSDLIVDQIVDVYMLKIIGNILISKSHQGILKEICWLVSNLAAGPSRHISMLVDADMFKCLCQFISTSTVDFDVLLYQS